MLKVLVISALLLGTAWNANAQTAPAAPAPNAPGAASSAPADAVAVAAARRLMAATHADRNVDLVIDRMMPSVMQGVSREYGLTTAQTSMATNIVTQEAHAAAPDLLKFMAELYARHLSAEDMNAIAAFFESPAGQRYSDQVPAILSESMAIGQAWGRDILAPRVEARVRMLLQQGQLQP